MTRQVRRAATGALAAAMVALTAAPAAAAPPTNDTFAGSVVIGAVPFSATVDTTEATTDAIDTQANAGCGAPATDASVWYSLTAAADGAILVDLTGSTYSAGAIVVTGDPGAFQLITCGPGAVAFGAAAGTTYHVVIFDDQFDGTGNGGTLRVSVGEAPPPPDVTVAVDATAGFDSRTGSATVTGGRDRRGRRDGRIRLAHR